MVVVIYGVIPALFSSHFVCQLKMLLAKNTIKIKDINRERAMTGNEKVVRYGWSVHVLQSFVSKNRTSRTLIDWCEAYPIRQTQSGTKISGGTLSRSSSQTFGQPGLIGRLLSRSHDWPAPKFGVHFWPGLMKHAGGGNIHAWRLFYLSIDTSIPLAVLTLKT